MSSPSKPSRGRSSRTRNGPRSSKTTREPALPQKPTPTVSTDKPPRNSTPHTAQSSPVSESPASPTSSRSSNRRRRSGAGRGNNVPKINPPLPDDGIHRPERSRFGAVPRAAPVKDRTPHLAQKPPRTPTTSAGMNKDIDALVERVRAVAMADHRPSTPGSHIDWAGEDDDSLPDLNDWGIPSLPDPTAHTISPIIVDGLRHLPELSSGLTAAATDKSVKSSPLVQEVQLEPGIQKPTINPSSPPKPQTTPEVHIASEPMASCHAPSLDKEASSESPPLDETARESGYHDAAELVSIEEKSRPERGGLAASIHAPQNATNSNSASGGRFPRYQQSHHIRAHTVGRPFPRLNQNDNNSSRSPRLSQGGSPKQHTRNYSSPATANRHSHSRPVLTGDALSRLVKAVGGTTVPSAKPTPLT